MHLACCKILSFNFLFIVQDQTWNWTMVFFWRRGWTTGTRLKQPSSGNCSTPRSQISTATHVRASLSRWTSWRPSSSDRYPILLFSSCSRTIKESRVARTTGSQASFSNFLLCLFDHFLCSGCRPVTFCKSWHTKKTILPATHWYRGCQPMFSHIFCTLSNLVMDWLPWQKCFSVFWLQACDLVQGWCYRRTILPVTHWHSLKVSDNTSGPFLPSVSLFSWFHHFLCSGFRRATPYRADSQKDGCQILSTHWPYISCVLYFVCRRATCCRGWSRRRTTRTPSVLYCRPVGCGLVIHLVFMVS